MLIRRPLLTLLLFASFLGACAQVEPTPAPSAQASPTTAPLPSVTPDPTRDPTPAPRCTDTVGKVRHMEAAIPGDDRPLSYWQYLPPCFDADRVSAYPTLYLLHGLAQSDSEWLDLGVAETADALIARGATPPFIIVLPGERTGFDMTAAVTEILLPEIESSLPAGGRAELRAIGGLSRGGGWALRTGMERPDLFGAIGLHSPAVISPDLYSLSTWAADIPPDSVPRLWVDIGSDDPLLRAALELREQLDKLRWPYAWTVSRGEHTSTYWSGHLERYLCWYAEAWPSEDPSAQLVEP